MRSKLDWEGANLPIHSSLTGAAFDAVYALRTPYVFSDVNELHYLLYSGSGEKNIAIQGLVPISK